MKGEIYVKIICTSKAEGNNLLYFNSKYTTCMKIYRNWCNCIWYIRGRWFCQQMLRTDLYMLPVLQKIDLQIPGYEYSFVLGSFEFHHCCKFGAPSSVAVQEFGEGGVRCSDVTCPCQGALRPRRRCDWHCIYIFSTRRVRNECGFA